MRKRTIGIITGNYRCDTLQSLAQERTVAAIPFGGRYRLLDFALSNMVNSGLQTVAIITPQKYRAILDQLGAGKDWFLDRKSGGLFILPGSNLGLHPRDNKFLLKDMGSNIEYLTRDNAEYVIISTSNIITNLDYRPILANHDQALADVTLIYKEMILEDDQASQFLLINDDNEVLGVEENKSKKGQLVKVFAETLIVRRQILIDILRGYENIEGLDLLDVLKENSKNLKIIAYPVSGYFGYVCSMESYYRHNMELLNPEIRNELFMGTNRIHTKIKDHPPTKYGEGIMVRNSLISSGCIIQGEVTGSIIFRGVQIEEGAVVRNSIIMQKSIIRKGAFLENVILDKHVEVRSNTLIKSEGKEPLVFNKAQIV